MGVDDTSLAGAEVLSEWSERAVSFPLIRRMALPSPQEWFIEDSEVLSFDVVEFAVSACAVKCIPDRIRVKERSTVLVYEIMIELLNMAPLLTGASNGRWRIKRFGGDPRFYIEPAFPTGG